MSRVQINAFVQDATGAAIPNTSVTLANVNFTATPVIYQNATGVATLAQPLTTNSDGICPGFIDQGTYNVSITAPQSVTSSYQWEAASGTSLVPSLPTVSAEWEGTLVTVRGSANSYIAELNPQTTPATYIWRQIMYVGTSTPSANQVLAWNGTIYTPTTLSISQITGNIVSLSTPVGQQFHGTVAAPLLSGGAVIGGTVTSLGAVNATSTVLAGSTITGQVFVPTGLTGAIAASRYAGAVTSATPASGSFNAGDFIVNQQGTIAVFSAGATWVPSVSSFNGRNATVNGAIQPQAGDYTPAQVGALPNAMALLQPIRYHRTASYNTVANLWTLLPVDTNDYDYSSGAYTLSSGALEVPATGAYQAIGSVNLGGTLELFVAFMVNGSLDVSSESACPTGSAGQAATVMSIIQCTAGQTIGLAYYTTAIQTLGEGTLTIMRIA